MDKTTPPYPPTPNNKYYYSSFLNLARHNAYLIIEKLTKDIKFDEEKLKESELAKADVIKHLKNVKEPETLSFIIQRLNKGFPFLEGIDSTNEESTIPYNERLQNELKEAFDLLNNLRNFYSHHDHSDHFLRRPIKFKVKDYFNNAKKKIIKRYPTKEETLISFFDGKELIKDSTLSDIGLLFFTCLFLEKKYAYRFLGRIFKITDNHLNEHLLEVFTYYCCKINKPKLQSGYTELDMIGELIRCPKQLFRNWDKEKQKDWISALDEKESYSSNNTPSAKNFMHRYEDRFPYFALRYFDDLGDKEGFKRLRFHFHLGKVRNLNYQYSKKIDNEERERVVVENVRSFARFSELKEEEIPEHWLNLKEKDVYSNLSREEKEDRLRDEVDQASTRYHIVGERIGIKFIRHKVPYLDGISMPQQKKFQNQPDAILSTYELQNLYFYHYLHKKGWIKIGIEELIKEYLLWFRDLCTRIKNKQLTLLINANNEEMQEKLSTYTQKYFKHQYEKRTGKEWNEMEQSIPFQPQIHYLPDNLKNYLKGVQSKSYKELVTKKLFKKIDEEKHRLKRLVDFFEIRKENLKTPIKLLLQENNMPRIGEIATYLADDMVKLMPINPQKRNKLNNQQYKLLQKKLALFSVHKDSLIAYFGEIGLTTGEKHKDTNLAHPFLYKLRTREIRGEEKIYSLTPDTILDFYQLYLQKKITFLKGANRDMIKKSWNDETIKANVGYFLNVDEKKSQLKNYLDSPIFLPRGLFNDAIRKALKKHDPKFENDFENKDTQNAGLVYCLDKGMPHLPKYYQDKRTYQFPNVSHQVISHDKFSFYLLKYAILKMQMDENEQAINAINDEIDGLKDTEKETKKKNKIQQLQAYNREKREKYNQFKKQLCQIGKISEDELEEKLNEIEINGDSKTLTRMLRNIRKNEQRIRYIQSTDKILWLMIQDIITEKRSGANLDQEDFDHNFFENIGFDQKANKKHDLSVKLKVNGSAYNISDNIHLRDYGRLRRFVKDRRLPNLLQHLRKNEDKTNFSRERIAIELEIYDYHREMFCKKALDFEQKVYSKADNDDQLMELLSNKKGNKLYLDHKKLLEVVFSYLGISEFKNMMIKDIALLRNKLFHNQVPFFSDAHPFNDLLENDKTVYDSYTQSEKIISNIMAIYNDLIPLLSTKHS